MEMNLITHISFPNVPGYEDITEGIGEGSMKFSSTLVDEEFRFGQYNASCFEVTLYDIPDVSGQRIQVYQEDTVSDNIIWVFNGIVDSAKTDRGKISRVIVAYDDLYSRGKLNCSTWWDNLWIDKSTTARMSILQILQSLCQFIEVGLSIPNDSAHLSYLASQMVIGYKPLGESIIIRDVLGMLCELIACFPEVSAAPDYNQGYGAILKIIRPLSHSHGDISDNFDTSESELEEYTPKNISGLVCVDGENKSRYSNITDTSNIYTISDNLFVDCLYKAYPIGTPYDGLYTDMQSIFSNISQLTPATVNLIYSVPVYDLVRTGTRLYTYDWVGCEFSFTDSDGTTHRCMVNRVELSGPQLVECSFDCILSEYLPTNAEYDNGTQMLVVKTDEMKSDIDTTQAEVTEVESDVTEAQSDIEELQTDVGTLQGDVETLQTDVETLQDDVATLQTDVTNVEGDVSDLDTRVTAISNLLSAVGEQLATVKAKTDAIVDYVVEQDTDANGWTYTIWNSGKLEATKNITLVKDTDFTSVQEYTRGLRSTGWYELVKTSGGSTTDTISVLKPQYLSTSGVQSVIGTVGYKSRTSSENVSYSIVAQIIRPVIRVTQADLAFNVLTLDDGVTPASAGVPNQLIYKLNTSWHIIGRSNKT